MTTKQIDAHISYTPTKKKGFYKFSESGIASYVMLAPFVLLFIVWAVYPV